MLPVDPENDLPLRVLTSAAGFYIGRYDENSGPISRESVEYWPYFDDAKLALDDGSWTKREEC